MIDYALIAHGVQFAFYDYKTAGVERARLERRCKALAWVLLAQPSMIKQPVPERDGDRLVGGTPEIDQRSFQKPAANRH